MQAELGKGTSGPTLPVFKIWGDSGTHPAVTLDRPVCIIGRQERANLSLPAEQVSKVHALVVREAGRVYLRDLASTNGVQLNGATVQEAGLSDEDVLKIGSYTLSCASGFGRHVGAHTAASPAVLRAATATYPFPRDRHTLLIGRREQCDVRLDHASVAPVHAILFEIDGHRYVQDLTVGNQTRVNGQPVQRGELQPGDELALGGVKLRYELLAPPDAPTAEAGLEETGTPIAAAAVEQARPDEPSLPQEVEALPELSELEAELMQPAQSSVEAEPPQIVEAEVEPVVEPEAVELDVQPLEEAQPVVNDEPIELAPETQPEAEPAQAAPTSESRDPAPFELVTEREPAPAVVSQEPEDASFELTMEPVPEEPQRVTAASDDAIPPLEFASLPEPAPVEQDIPLNSIEWDLISFSGEDEPRSDQPTARS